MSVKKFFTEFGSDFLDMLYPKNISCAACNVELCDNAVNGFCETCYASLPFNNRKVCMCCGSAIENLAAYCNRCQNTVFEFEAARSSFSYEGIISNLIYKFKFGGNRYLAEIFAVFMADTLNSAWTGYDLVIPVPVHEKTLKKRGFNQAEDLAREMCKLTGESELLRTDLFVKTVYTPEQARLTGRFRAENLEDTFAVTKKPPLRDKIILLVDDVLTTGATANECAKTLKRGGASAVYVITLASTTYKPVFDYGDELIIR